MESNSHAYSENVIWYKTQMKQKTIDMIKGAFS